MTVAPPTTSRISPVEVIRDLAIGLAVGIFSGMFGVGGGLVLVPFLVLVMHVAQKRAQATSLVMVALAATSGAITYARADSVAWLPSLVLVAGGLIGTLVGTTWVTRTPDRRLQLLFGLLLLAATARMVWGSFGQDTSTIASFSMATALGYVLSGIAMGVLSAMMGVGGGVIIIPILVAFFGFPQDLAAGTSLLVMIPIALVGATRLSRGGYTNWPQGLRFGVGAIGGAVVGAAVALAVSASIVQGAFAALLLVTAIQMLVKSRKGEPSLSDPTPTDGVSR